MADESEGYCPVHEKSRVALYCQTCELLICTRCVSHGSQSSAQHRQHVYLDLNEAFDLIQEDVNGLTSGLRDDLLEKKKHMQSVQARLQRLQLSLLRKKTQLKKCTGSLEKTVKKREKCHLSSVENLITPAIATAQQQYNDLEYDVVSGDALLALAETLQQTPKEKLVSFLKSAVYVKKEYETMRSKMATTYKDHTEALERFKNVGLHLRREKYLLDRAFTFANEGPSPPQPLHSWCVIAEHSASIVWKFDKTNIIKCFNIYYKKYSDTDREFIKTRQWTKTVVYKVARNCSEASQIVSIESRECLKQSNSDKDSKTDMVLVNGTIVDKGEGVTKDDTKQSTNLNNANATSKSKGCWFGFRWLFGSKNQAECKDTIESGSDSVVSEESDISSENEDIQSSQKDESPTSSEEIDEKNKEESTITVKEVQRSQSYIDPCEFWKEMQLNSSSSESFKNPHVKDIVDNKKNLGSRKPQSPARRYSTTTAQVTPKPRSTTPNHSQRRMRVHSLEQPRNVVSPLLSKNRSQTPVKFVPKASNPKASMRSASPCLSGKVGRGDGQHRGNSGRMSRRDQPMREKSEKSISRRNNNNNNEPLNKEKIIIGMSEGLNKPAAECSENGDENVKDRFNEKNYSKSFGNSREKKDQVKDSNGKTNQIDGQAKQKKAKKEWQKNMKMNIFDESEESCQTESEEKEVTMATEGQSRQRRNTYTKEEADEAKQRHKKDRMVRKKVKETRTHTCETQYACIKSIPAETLETFQHFQVQRFVLGRVHVTLRDLQADTHYIALITSENIAGESEASVVQFKTGSSKGFHPENGHVIKGVQGHRTSWIKNFKNGCYNLCTLLFLALCVFFSFYVMHSYVQSSLCSQLAKKNVAAISKLCPDLAPSDLCSEFHPQSTQQCQNMVHTESYDSIVTDSCYDNPLDCLFQMLDTFIDEKIPQIYTLL